MPRETRLSKKADDLLALVQKKEIAKKNVKNLQTKTSGLNRGGGLLEKKRW